MVIRLFTLFTPLMSLTSLSTKSFSASLLALPYTVTTIGDFLEFTLQLLKRRINRQRNRIIPTGDLLNRQPIGFAKRFVRLHKQVISIGIKNSSRDGVYCNR
jgi:hypothetical protein